MTHHLMNAAVMPHAGMYEIEATSLSSWIALARAAFDKGDLESSIGYPQTAAMLERLLDRPVECNRNSITLRHGDAMLICRLKYRPQAGVKSDPVWQQIEGGHVENYEFLLAKYRKR
jgi:hypothetical protein